LLYKTTVIILCLFKGLFLYVRMCYIILCGYPNLELFELHNIKTDKDRKIASVVYQDQKLKYIAWLLNVLSSHLRVILIIWNVVFGATRGTLKCYTIINRLLTDKSKVATVDHNSYSSPTMCSVYSPIVGEYIVVHPIFPFDMYIVRIECIRKLYLFW